MKNKKLIHVATLGQPQGLRGGIKINIHTANSLSFESLSQFFLEDGISEISFKSFKKIGKKYVSIINGCNDRDAAEAYRGKKIFTYRENFPNTNDNKYYVSDLIGCKVINKEKEK